MAVTAVDIEPASEDVPELRSDTAAARLELATADGTRHVMVSAGYGLKLAVVAGAPVRVADAVMNQRAVPVQGEDVLAPFLLQRPAAGPSRAGAAFRAAEHGVHRQPGLLAAVRQLPGCRPAALAGLFLHRRRRVRCPCLRGPRALRFRRPVPGDLRRRLPRPPGHLPRTAAHHRRRRPGRAASGRGAGHRPSRRPPARPRRQQPDRPRQQRLDLAQSHDARPRAGGRHPVRHLPGRPRPRRAAQPGTVRARPETAE
jgi:hypothetical protein